MVVQTNVSLSAQNPLFCPDKRVSVGTKPAFLSRQTCLCRHKTRLSRQTCLWRDKTRFFVQTNVSLAAQNPLLSLAAQNPQTNVSLFLSRQTCLHMLSKARNLWQHKRVKNPLFCPLSLAGQNPLFCPDKRVSGGTKPAFLSRQTCLWHKTRSRQTCLSKPAFLSRQTCLCFLSRQTCLWRDKTRFFVETNVSLSGQNPLFCRDKRVSVGTKRFLSLSGQNPLFCPDKRVSVGTKPAFLSVSVGTKPAFLSRQTCLCRDKTRFFVETNVSLSGQNPLFCRDKRFVGTKPARDKHFCRDKNIWSEIRWLWPQ